MNAATPQRRMFVCVRLIVATLLLFASSAKLLSESPAQLPLLIRKLGGQEIAWWSLLEVEFAIGLWAFCGVFPRLLRPAMSMTFLALAVVAFVEFRGGNKSCSCFGTAGRYFGSFSSPAVLCALDLLMAVATLLLPVAPRRFSQIDAVNPDRTG